MPKQRSYTLEELLSQCDPDAPMPPEFKEWENAEPVGLEITGMDDRGNDDLC